MVYITHIRLSASGTLHQHIADVKWHNPSNGATGQSTRAAMVDWIQTKNGDARVRSAVDDVRIGVVKGNPPYIRTYANGLWTDNLLNLPLF